MKMHNGELAKKFQV